MIVGYSSIQPTTPTSMPASNRGRSSLDPDADDACLVQGPRAARAARYLGARLGHSRRTVPTA